MNQAYEKFLAYGFVPDPVQAARTAEWIGDVLAEKGGQYKNERSSFELIDSLFKNLVKNTVDRANNDLILGLSAGFDSRPLLYYLKQKGLDVSTYTFGQSGNLDFDFIRQLIAREHLADNNFIDTASAGWSLPVFDAAALENPDLPISPRVLAADWVRPRFGSEIELHGYLNGVLTGGNLESGISDDWSQALERFIGKNNFFGWQKDLLARGEVFPGRPPLPMSLLGYDDQLDIFFKQAQRIRLSDDYYLFPYEDEDWIAFWLTRPFSERVGQRLWIWFIKQLESPLFVDVAASAALDKKALRRDRLNEQYGSTKGLPLGDPRLGGLVPPHNPTQHFSLYACFMNNESFRLFCSALLDRTRCRGIVAPSVVESVQQRFIAGDREAEKQLNGILSLDLMVHRESGAQG